MVWMIIIFVFFVPFAQSQDNCIPIKSCSECLVTTDCSWCTSSIVSGCVNSTADSSLQTTCTGLLGGQWNDCGASGSTCFVHPDCDSCNFGSSCDWCALGTSGICVSSGTSSSFLCNLFGGVFFPTCPTGGLLEDSCQKFNGLSLCGNEIFYDVFVFQGSTQKIMSTNAESILNLTVLPGVNQRCRDIVRKYGCAENFRKCEIAYINGESIPVGVRPCRSICQSVNAECAEAFKSFNLDPLDCGIYSENEVVFSFGTDSYVTTCNNMIAPSNEYYLNSIRNPGFEHIFNDSLAYDWLPELLGDYTIVLDDVLNETSNVLSFSGDGNSTLSASQEILFDRSVVVPFVVEGWSKAENVSGDPSANYSLTLHVTYQSDSEEEISILFNTGTHDYEQEGISFLPNQPVKTVRVELRFDYLSGVVYFDNLVLQEERLEYDLQYECTRPLLQNPEVGPEDDYCQIPCLPPIFKGNAWEEIIKMSEVVNWFSFILSLFLILTWFLRRYGKNYSNVDTTVLYFSICTFLIGFAGGPFITIFGSNNILCKDERTRNRDSISLGAGPCIVQGILYIWGSTALMVWWLCNAIKLYLAVHYPRSLGLEFAKRRKIRDTQWTPAHIAEVSFHVASWGFPTLVVIIALSARKVGAGVAGILCFLITDSYNWALFFGPMGLALVIGAPLIIKLMHTIYKIRKETNRPLQFSIYVRFAVFLGYFLVNFIVLFAYRLLADVKSDDWEKSFNDDVLCRATSDDEDCPKDWDRPPVVLFGLANLVISLQGVLIFAIFGTQKHNIEYWKRLFTCSLGIGSSNSSTNVKHASSVESLGEMQISEYSASYEKEKSDQ